MHSITLAFKRRYFQDLVVNSNTEEVDLLANGLSPTSNNGTKILNVVKETNLEVVKRHSHLEFRQLGQLSFFLSPASLAP